MLEYSSSPNPEAPARGGVDGRMRPWGESAHCETMTSAERWGATNNDQSAEGKCRSRYVIGSMSSTLRGPRHILQWTSKFTRKCVKSNPGGEVYAFSEMVGHTSLLREFYAHFVNSRTSLPHLKNKKTIPEKFPIRQFPAIRQSLEDEELDNANRLPGLENPADGRPEVESGMAPLPRLAEAGT